MKKVWTHNPLRITHHVSRVSKWTSRLELRQSPCLFHPQLGPVTSLSPSCAAEPESRLDPFGEGCLSAASSRAILIRDGGGGTPESLLLSRVVGPRAGEHGFGHFCRNQVSRCAGAKPRIQIICSLFVEPPNPDKPKPKTSFLTTS